MSIATQSRAPGFLGVRARYPMLVPPLVALVYPYILKGFNAGAAAIIAARPGVPLSLWLVSAISLALAILAPFLAMAVAMNLGEIERPSAAQLRAKRVALLAVAAPPIFVTLGVILYMFHDPVPDTWLWVLFWAAMTALVARGDNDAPAATAVRPPPAWLRVAHGVSALGIVAIFLAWHLSTHLTSIVDPATYNAVMKAFRHIYRTELTQPLLVALIFFQVGSGIVMAWRHTAARSDRFRTFQIASGIYLGFFVLGHMNSVFIFARAWLGIDTGWDFATGAPTGLIKDAWNIRLVPHYLLGVFLVISHLFAGGRAVMMTHGIRRAFADRFMFGGVIAAGAVATVILLGMCGLRVHFA
jgi:hypothetical protein